MFQSKRPRLLWPRDLATTKGSRLPGLHAYSGQVGVRKKCNLPNSNSGLHWTNVANDCKIMCNNFKYLLIYYQLIIARKWFVLQQGLIRLQLFTNLRLIRLFSFDLSIWLTVWHLSHMAIVSRPWHSVWLFWTRNAPAMSRRWRRVNCWTSFIFMLWWWGTMPCNYKPVGIRRWRITVLNA